MVLFPNNPITDKLLIYTGIPVLVFAIIYYFLLKNSYCNKAEVLCKNPIIINSKIKPNMISFVSQSADSIEQNIKCDPLPVSELQIYSKTTNKWIALYGLIFMIIILLILSLDPGSGVGKLTIFNAFKTDDITKFQKLSTVIFAFLVILIIINYFIKGYEYKSIFMIITLILIYISAIIIYYINSGSGNYNFNAQACILVIIIFVILFVVLTSFKYIYNLELGHAVTSSGAIATFIVQIIFIIFMGIALIDNKGIFNTKTSMYLIYIAIFITIIIQTVLLGAHIYKCIWKTYECEPEIDIQKNKDTAKLNINCVAKLDINKTMIPFILLAILFMILPNEDVIALIKSLINKFASMSKDISSGINDLISNVFGL